MWRYITPLVLFAALVVFFLIGLERDPRVVPSPLIGKPAPRFVLPSVEDPERQVSSAEYVGRVWVLNVWATWCGGCRQEHDVLLAIAKEGRVPIVGLNWKDDRDLARRWLTQLGDPYVETAFDVEGRVAIDWGVYGAPETFLVDTDGTVLHKHLAPLTQEIWQRDFMPLIEAAEETGS